VPRLRWSDPEPDDPSTPLDWRIPAAILATIFLNVPFWLWQSYSLWSAGPLPGNAIVFLAVALLAAALSFAAPAFAAQQERRSLLAIAESSLGKLPAFVLRLFCLAFLACWLVTFFLRPVSWMCYGEVSPGGWRLLATALLAFTFFTAMQTPGSMAKLAAFANKLGIAILIAALIRVRDGWPAIWQGFSWLDANSRLAGQWRGLGILLVYLVPVFFLTADFGRRAVGPKPVIKFALFGLTLPLFATLLVVASIDVATLASSAYQPSLVPSVFMALTAHVSRRALPAINMLVTLTIFGAMRFTAASLVQCSLPEKARVRARYMALIPFIGIIVWLSTQSDKWLLVPLEYSAATLAVASAILTVDFLTAKWRVARQQRLVDWGGACALLAGSTAALYLPAWIVGTAADGEWSPRILPSYAVGFLVCLAARALRF
jgi:hypothetical protein